MTKIAIIGGSGLENPEILHNAKRTKVETPYGIQVPILYAEQSGR